MRRLHVDRIFAVGCVVRGRGAIGDVLRWLVVLLCRAGRRLKLKGALSPSYTYGVCMLCISVSGTSNCRHVSNPTQRHGPRPGLLFVFVLGGVATRTLSISAEPETRRPGPGGQASRVQPPSFLQFKPPTNLRTPIRHPTMSSRSRTSVLAFQTPDFYSSTHVVVLFF